MLFRNTKTAMQPKPKRPINCCYPDCKYLKKRHGVYHMIYELPKCDELKEKWIESIKAAKMFLSTSTNCKSSSNETMRDVSNKNENEEIAEELNIGRKEKTENTEEESQQLQETEDEIEKENDEITLTTAWTLCPLHFKEIYEKNLKVLEEIEVRTRNASKIENNENEMSQNDNSIMIPIDDKTTNNFKFILKSIEELKSIYANICKWPLILRYCCAVPGCATDIHTENVKLFRFPVHQDMIKKWCHNTQIKHEGNMDYYLRVCALHFESVCLSSSVGDSSRLKYWAVPTLKLPTGTKDIIENFIPENPLNGFKQYHDRCCILSCMNALPLTGGGKDKKLILHCFPRDEELFEKWLEATALTAEAARNARICNLHFNLENNKCTRLPFGAVPSLYLSQDPNYFCNNLVQNEIEDDFPNNVTEALDIKIEIEDENDNENEPSMCYTTEMCAQTMESSMKTSKAEQPRPEGSLDASYLTTNSNNNTYLFQQLSCSVPNCGKLYESGVVHLHRLPKLPQYREKWLNFCGLVTQEASNPTANIRICSEHFDDNCYVGKRRIQLKVGALPTLYPNNELNSLKNIEETPSSFGTQQCFLDHCWNHNSSGCNHFGVRTFYFPTCAVQQEKWEHNLGIKFDMTMPWLYTICEEHFEKRCFNYIAAGNDEVQLHKWAVPTLNLGVNAPTILFTNDYHETEEKVKRKRQLTALNQHQIINNTNENYVDEREGGPTPAKKIKIEIDDDDVYDDYDYDYDNDNDNESTTTHSIQLIDNNSNSILKSTSPAPTSCKGKQLVLSCNVTSCKNTNQMPGIKIFSKFPINYQLFHNWCTNLKIDPGSYQGTGSYNVCSVHFEAYCFDNKKLYQWAVPTLHLGYDDANKLNVKDGLLPDEMWL